MNLLILYIQKSGTVISPRAAGIMKDSKNVEGAKEFIDYLLSDDVQKTSF